MEACEWDGEVLLGAIFTDLGTENEYIVKKIEGNLWKRTAEFMSEQPVRILYYSRI